MSKTYLLGILIILITAVGKAQEKFPEPDAYVHTDMPAEVVNLEEFYLNLTYPAEIYETKKEGSVYLKVLVDKKGKYVKHLVLKSADSLFTVHASRTVPMLRFKPAQSSGQAVATWVTVPVRFQVKNIVAKAKNYANPKTKLCEGLWTYYKDYKDYWVKNVSEAVSFVIADYGKSDSMVVAKRYTRNGSLISTGAYLYRGDSLLRHGKFEFFVRDSIKIEEGMFHKDEREGEWKEYFDSGLKKTLVNYLSGKRNGKAYAWYENGRIKIEGYFTDGKRNGMFTRFDSAGKPSLKLLYESDKLIKAYEFNSEGGSVEAKKPLDTYNRPPEFKGNFKEYIKHNLQYPSRAYKRRINGDVYIRFFIDENGAVSDPQIVRGIGYGCDEEALRLIKLTSGNWSPAISDGAAEKTVFVQKIIF